MSFASPIGEAARLVANAVGARLGSNGPFRVRVYPAQVAGDIEWATVELPPRALAVVFGGLLDGSSLTVRDGRLVGFRAVAELVEAAAAYAGDGADVPNAIDVVCAALPYVAERVVVDGSWWRVSFWGEWDHTSTSGATLGLGGDEWDLVWLTQTAGGVELRVDGEARPAVRARDELPAALERLAGEVRAAVDARAAYRARPFSIRTVGERLLAALGRKSWKLRVRERYPYDPDADIWHRDDVGEHFEAILNEHDGVVTVDGLELRNLDELEAALPALVAEIRADAARLRSDHLRPGAGYRVLRPFKGLAVGQRVTFFKVEHYPHDGGSRWIFGGSFALWDQSDADCEILSDLHRYLALDLPP
jgi:hypothetical protein